MADGKLRTYTNDYEYHAEGRFIKENFDLNDVGKELWINNSPCPRCALNLIHAYQGYDKPVIAIAHFYVGGYGEELALHCLARMVANGFSLIPFNWIKYRNQLNYECRKDINRALINKIFLKKMINIENKLKLVKKYASSGKTDCPYNPNWQ